MGSFAHLARVLAQVGALFLMYAPVAVVPERAVRYSGLRSPGALPQCALM